MGKSKIRVMLALFVMMLGLYPFLNSLSSPHLAAAHGSDIMQFMAAGLCLGFGVGLLVGAHKFSGE
jgi:flagellar biosynthesis protein FliR